MKDKVTLLVVGDDGVGKSSLISTYISNNFPVSVPQVIADSDLPGDSDNTVSITIMDSSSKLVDREVLIQKMKVADCIITLYDSTRLETLGNLSKVWLPLIMSILNDNNNDITSKSVIVSSTKTDILTDNNSKEQEERLVRQLLTDFPIISADCISSAKLEKVDNVFNYALLVVLCPLHPLFNIYTGQLTNKALCAYLHIFRIFDIDNDNLLSDDEMMFLHKECFNDDTITIDELNDIKRSKLKNNPLYVNNNNITYDGLIQIIKKSIEDSILQTPWEILRTFNYEDDLSIQLPDDLNWTTKSNSNDFTILSNDAREFLYRLYLNAYNDLKTNRITLPIDYNYVVTTTLTDAERLYNEAISFIFAVLDVHDNNPWSHFPVYHSDKSSNRYEQKYLLSSPSSSGSFTGQIVDIWILHWHMLAMYNPSLTQNLLYRIGYVDRPNDKGVVLSKKSKISKKSTDIKLDVVKVCVLGKDGVGKRSYIWELSSLANLREQYSSNEIVTGGCLAYINDSTASTITTNIIATAVPHQYSEQWLADNGKSCDIAILLFECNNEESLSDAIKLENLLPKDLPRIYIANKIDLLTENNQETILSSAAEHLQRNQLPDLIYLSTQSDNSVKSTISSILETIESPSKGIPLRYRKNSLFYWKWLYIPVSFVTVLGVGVGVYFHKDFISKICNSWKEFNKFQWFDLLPFRFTK